MKRIVLAISLVFLAAVASPADKFRAPSIAPIAQALVTHTSAKDGARHAPKEVELALGPREGGGVI
jgi:hypothetical protein